MVHLPSELRPTVLSGSDDDYSGVGLGDPRGRGLGAITSILGFDRNFKWGYLMEKGSEKNLKIGITLAIDCLTPYQKALQLGLVDLQLDMEKAEPYDHDQRDPPKEDYEKKNEYFNRANSFGYPFLTMNITGRSKKYYWKMLKAITKYEKEYEKPLNKGMVCANLGVSALAEGDIDGGIAYLAWAMREDRSWIKDSTRNIFNNPLYEQFPKATKRRGISQFGKRAPWIMLEEAVEEYNIEFGDNVKINDVFTKLEGSPEHRALLEGALWVIHRNLALLREENDLGIYRNENNIYTKLRLFDGIVSLCRFIELRMRHHEKNLPPKSPTLGLLLEEYIFKNETWYKSEVEDKNTKPQTPKDFDELVQDAIQNGKRPYRDILLLLVIRNYSVHICDPETPFFFRKFEKIFNEIIIAYVYYLKFRKKL